MAKYSGPSCRLCRREGVKLFLKGTRCVSDKCAFTRREKMPGQHGQTRSKLSDYGVQLREKQKVKRIYGVLEKQFKLYFQMAERSKGVTGEKLLELLERRLDNVIFRLNLASSRAWARILVKHGHIKVNNKKVDIPSFLVKESDTVELEKKDNIAKLAKDNLEILKDKTIPSWLNLDKENLKATVLRLPKKEDVGFPIKEQLIVELYSK